MDRTVTLKQEETSGHEPQSGLDTKTDRLTDRQSLVTLTLIIGSSVVVKLSTERQPVKRRLSLCCSYSETLINPLQGYD
jgi:hypothetical protein